MLNHSLLSFFIDAGPMVKGVMFLLLLISVISWAVIFQRSFLLRRATGLLRKFEDVFWGGTDLNTLYQRINDRKKGPTSGAEEIFHAGFKEFSRLQQQQASSEAVMEGAERVMRIAQTKEVARLEDNLSMLATIGSTSPYIGLFGTVWGIMTSFQALGQASQASIAMVAPGISEALIATAMGLFAAIPAVIAYNRYINKLDRLAGQYDIFQEELTSIFHRQLHRAPNAESDPAY